MFEDLKDLQRKGRGKSSTGSRLWPHAVGRPWPFAVPVTTTLSMLGVVDAH